MTTSHTMTEPIGTHVTPKGPQHSTEVRILETTRTPVGLATCFWSSWTDAESHEAKWRGFLSAIAPPGSVAPGKYLLDFGSGAHRKVCVRTVRHEPREQAVFVGDGPPPTEDQIENP